MPPQHVEMAETAAAFRRKLRRDKESSHSQPAQIATNRGNKLRPGARYVHAGSLPWRYGAGKERHGGGKRFTWTEKVNHAGFDRDILIRNPRRYNEYGDELDDSESDAEADADADEENPYGEIKLEELLRPLTHPSELANHPTMAQAYLDPALPDMVLATDAKIREERNNLSRAKNLYRYFTGDETWIPCERVEAESDWELFDPNSRFTARLDTGESPTKRRRLHLDDGLDGHVQVADAFQGQAGVEDVLNGTLNDLQEKAGENGTEVETADLPEGHTADFSMTEVDDAQPEPVSLPQTNGVHKQEHADTEMRLPGLLAQQNNGYNADVGTTHLQEPTTHDGTDASMDQTTSNMPDHHDETAEDGDNEEDEEAETASTPPPPPRRITRALAAEAETASTAQIASPPPTSPTLSSQSPSTFEPHPLFLLPTQLATAHTSHHAYPMLSVSLAHSGLPPEELLETRKLLSLYIQKSEETIRGLENILGKLIKAKRRRERLWEWCVAEGHVGEMSDGEDWIDEAYWGLTAGELRKGRDEDASAVVEGVALPANANAVGDGGNGGGTGTAAGEGETSVIMGGRKGKRRGRAKD